MFPPCTLFTNAIYTTDLAPSTGSWASTNDGRTKEVREEEKALDLEHKISFDCSLRRRKPVAHAF